MRILFLIALLVSIASGSAIPEAEASKGSDKTIRVKAGQSIQNAIRSAPRGSRIVVSSGSYAEQLTIRTDGITLIGEEGAILAPPVRPVQNECTNFAGPTGDKITPSQAGICVTGSGLDLSDFVSEHKRVKSVKKPVKGVSVSGFTVSGFSGFNILVVGAEDAEVCSNTLLDGPKYGFLTAGSANTKVSNNEITSTAPVFHFIGICMDNFSKVKVTKNKISSYYIGLCIQTNGAEVEDNHVSDACYRAFLDPGVKDVRFRRNTLANAAFPAICGGFGAGIDIHGAVGARVEDNVVTGWKTTDEPNNGGIVLIDEPCANPSLACPKLGVLAVASNNLVRGNTLSDNTLDIFVNTTGRDNRFRGNRCTTSNKGGVCGRT